MAESNIKTDSLSRILLGIIAGVVVPFLVVGFLNIFAWGIGGLYDYWWGKIIVIVIAFIIPSFLAGYMTITISKSNNLYLNFITFTILILIALINNDFRGFGPLFETIAFLSGSLLFMFLGGVVAHKRRKFTDDQPSPPDIP
jgi:hypothetical protein